MNGDIIALYTYDLDIYLSTEKIGKIFTDPMYKLLLGYMVISDVYSSFIPNKKVVNS